MTSPDRFIDRTRWQPGPWDDEDDHAEFYTDSGRPCLARRNRLGAWCGYVAVDPGHPWHGADYDGITAEVRVHGSLTFASPCMEDDRPQHERVCHVPRPGEPDDVWWLGFDCAHGHDVIPAMAHEGVHRFGAEYRTLDYVREQCELLAAQVDGAAP